MKKHNENLALTKIMACLAVVGIHTFQRELSLFNLSLYYCCGFAVPVFWMSSGYVLLNREQISAKYVIKKVLSIIRVVILWSILIAIMVFLKVRIRGVLDIKLLISFPLIAIKSVLQIGYLWQFWYLGALTIVYLLIPVFYLFKDKQYDIWRSCLVIGVLFQLSSYCLGAPIQKHFIQTFRLWTWVQYFILGGLLKNRIGKVKIKRCWHGTMLLVLTIAIVVFQVLIGRNITHELRAEYFYDELIFVVWVVTLFTFIMRLKISANSSFIVLVERIEPLTMGIYIVHPLLIFILSSFIEINTILGSIVYFLFIFLASTAISYIMSRIKGVRSLIKL